MVAIIICTLRWRQKLIPLTTKLQHIGPQHVLKDLNSMVWLAISLWVKCCTQFNPGAQIPLECSLEAGGEP